MSLIRRQIDFTFRLGKGSFGQSGTNTVKLSGLRAKVDIVHSGGPSMGQATCRLYGLTRQMMNDLQTLYRSPEGNIEFRFNTLVIDAGDDVNKVKRVFQGHTTMSSVDMADVPSSSLVVLAQAGAFDAVLPSPPATYPGQADAAVILASLADRGGYVFENNSVPGGIQVPLDTPYCWGSLRDQMLSVVKAANIEWNGLENGVLAIWPKGAARDNGLIPIIGPGSGMVGYPSNTQSGIAVKCEFNPKLRIGGKVFVKSALPFANGLWVMYNIAHELSSEFPDGPWFSTFTGNALGQ